MKSKLINFFPGIIFVLIGGGFLFIGLFFGLSGLDFEENARETLGTITKIETYRDSDDEIRHTAYVSYAANGETYNQSLSYYSSSMYEGKKIKVYYDPGIPSKIQVEGENSFKLIIGIFGGVFVLIGIVVTVYQIKKLIDQKKLIQMGERIYANIVDVTENMSYTVNNRHPYVITCEWNGPDGIVVFKSQNIWDDPQPIIDTYNITTMSVYIDRENPKKYFMSLENLIGIE